MEEIPKDTGAEMALLGAAMLGKYSDLSATGCNANHFNDLRCRSVWVELEAMDSEGVSLTCETVCHRLRTHKDVNILDINNMIDSCPSAVSWPYWYSIVADKMKAREVQQAGWKLVQEATTTASIDDLVSQAESVVYGLTKLVTTDPDSRKNSFQRVIQSLEDAHNGKAKGMETGFPSLDRILGGLRGGQLCVIAARPAVGKSAMAGNIATHLVQQGHGVAFFSYEMTADELNMRMLSSVADVDLVGDVLNQNEDADGRLRTIAKTSNHVPSLAKAPLHIVDNASLSIHQIRSRARKLVKDEGVKLVIIDYLQLIKPSVDDKRRDRHLQIGSITAGLKQMAMELDIPVIALAQLNRGVEGNRAQSAADKRPKLSDLRESGSIEQDADLVLFLYAEQMLFDGPNVLLKLAIGKNRAGRQGAVDLVLVRNRTRFEEASEPHHEEWLNRKRSEQLADD